MVNSKELLREFQDMSYDDKYDKLLAISGVLKQKSFQIAEIYVYLDLLRGKKSITSEDLIEIYQVILSLVDLYEKKKLPGKLEEIDKKIAMEIEKLNKLAKMEQTRNHDVTKADTLLEDI